MSNLAGISIRTLHHYDRIGLLKPLERTEKGYRLYGRHELFRLQQILFFKELDFSLREIAEIVNNENFDLLDALEFHREQLTKRADRLAKLVETVDKTIDELRSNKENEMTEKEMYEGFSDTEIKEIRREVSERWGKSQLAESEANVRKLGKNGLQAAKKEGEEICRLLASLMHLAPSNAQVQNAVSRYHQHLNTFYEVSLERYRGLARMYVEDERFTAYYEKFGAGLAAFLRRAIGHYCDSKRK